MFSFDFDASAFFGGIDALTRAVLDGLAHGLVLAGNSLLYDSRQIVPFDTGALSASGAVGKPQTNGEMQQIDVSYNKDYAVKVHEDMSLKIRQTFAVAGAVRQQKYLTKPMMENAAKYGKILSDEFTSILSGAK